MVTCVNLNDRLFKDCCKRLNVSPATLEPIVHEYINIEGNEDSFPSDVYIEERIHGSSQPVLSDKQVKIWEERFSEAVQFDDVLEAMFYVTEAERFFPRESIGIKENLNGKVEIRVKKPSIFNIEKIKDNLEDNLYFNTSFSENYTYEDLIFDQILNKFEGIFTVHKTKTGLKVSLPHNMGYSLSGKNVILKPNIKNKINKVLNELGLPLNLFRYKIEQRGNKNFHRNHFRVHINTELLQDKILPIEEGESMFGSLETYVKELEILNFLKEKTGLEYKFISEEEAYTKSKKIKPTTNAFVKDNIVYFIKGKKFNIDIISEEFLHPFVASIKKYNKELFESLLKEAVKAYPKLTVQIEHNYVTDKQEELVTQALARTFRKEYEENPNHRNIKELLNKFWEFIKNLFNLNNVNLDVVLASSDIFADEIASNIGLDNLAIIINSELKLRVFDVGPIERHSESNSKEFNAKVKEIQETLGVSEERARELAETYNEDSTQEELKSNEEAIEELDAIYKETLRVGEQIEALTKSRDILKAEIIEIAYDIVYSISDFLTQWQDNPDTLYQNFKHLNKQDKDKIATMSRGELVAYIGVNNLLDFIKETYFGSIKDSDSDALQNKKYLLYENFDAVIKFGISAFNSVEDFSLSYSEVGYTVTNQNTEDVDSELTNAEQSIKEENGDKQEHWQIDSRTIDNFLSMSQLVKRELVRLYLTEEVIKEGQTITKPQTNEYGINKRVDPKDATSSILRWTRGALTLEQMIKQLEDKIPTKPWVKALVDKLNDKSSKYADFQSQFFSVFCKHFQDYYIVIEEKQKDGSKISKVIPININPALGEVMKGIKLSYELNAHPMFINGTVDEKAFDQFKRSVEKLEKLSQQPYESLDTEQISTGISFVAGLLGFSITKEQVELALNPTSFAEMIKHLKYILNNVSKGKQQQTYEPFVYVKGGNSITTNLRNFLKPLTDMMEDVAISSVYDSGKMYQSYVLPSWLSKTMDKFLTLEGAEYEEFLRKEYGQYEWFRDTRIEDIKKGWKSPWLGQLARMTLAERKEAFGHHVQLNYLGHNYMKNMSAPEYTLAVFSEFFSDTTDDKESIGYSYYKVPMMSNKPSLEFIKFIRYKGLDYEDSIVKGLKSVYLQELARIQTVIKRGYKKGDPQFIVPFDSRGRNFLFLEYLNDYLNGSKQDEELGQLLKKKVNGEPLPDYFDEKGEKKSGDARLLQLVEEEIRSQMTAKADKLIEEYKSNGVFEAAKSIQGIGKTDAEVKANLRNFIWNDTFATINILEMTITDLAYYKNTEDVQKRLAQIHAPGMKCNVQATDYQGNPVCDGYLRSVFLADYEGDAVIQNIIENLEIVFDRRIDSSEEGSEKEYWTATKEAIIKAFKKINVADAQAYNCPTSYRKKALMFGKWSKEFEETYKKLKDGKWNATDLQAAFQPLKPFVYTHVTKSSGVEDAPIKTMKVGMQFKNSEYLLILADAILQGEDTGKPNILRAIFEVMEDSAEKDPTKGIDTFMFASAVKAGLHGRIDLKDFLEKGDAKAYIKGLIEDSTSEDGYNATYVHTYPAEDYIIQQEVPKHFLDHNQAHGSQERFIIPSDLQAVYEDGSLVYYEYKDGEKTIRLTAEEFKREYEETIATNIQESIDDLFEELGLKFEGPNAKKLRNIALSKILQKEILSNPRYGVDLYIACSVDNDGNFKIPLGDPIQSKRVEQLINSIIKNRVNKQKIAGGPVVQVSNFGLSKRLNIRFKDKDGNALPTFTEWSNEEENKGKTVKEFKEFLKENQAGVAYYECYAPAYMKEMFECFMDENGNIDIKAIEESNPEMLEMIGYRIPSEDLYSVAPLRIMGFLPKEAGEGLMLPYEITVITGSDFDIDKFYLMRKEFNIKLNKVKDIRDSLIKKFGHSRREEIQMFLDQALDVNTRRDAYINYPDIAKEFRRRAFSVEKPTKGRRYRNNKIIDMSLSVLTHETATHRLLNPGGFEPQKRMGYMVTAYKMGKGTWEYLNTLDVDSLKELCYTDKNLVYMDVNTQFYEQNNVAGTILGMFAVQKIAHAVLEGNKYYLDVNMTLSLADSDFKFAGHTFSGLTEIDPTKNSRGEYIGKILGSLVASAADAVKDPVLNLMNINSTTAPVLTAMIRLGIPFETASMLLSQQTITDLLQKFNIENLKGFTSFKELLSKEIEELRKQGGSTIGDEISTEEMTEEELVSGLTKEASIKVKLKGLLAFEKFLSIAGELRGITYATRFNSISNAVGPLAIDNIIMQNKLSKFSSAIFELVPGIDEEGNKTLVKQEVGFDTIFKKHPILGGFRETLDIATMIFSEHFPVISADFNTILANLPENIRDKMFGDRKLFSKFVDFYLSYLLVSSGCIESSEKKIKFYADEFPQKLFERKIKTQYPNNPFIQALRFEKEKVGKGEEKLVIKINTTGMSTTEKEKLSSGWTDLHRENPKLSMMFFEYCFFRGGIGFTPKTFMHLLPLEVKLELPNYIKTFREKQGTNAAIFVNQFIRNNWFNGKIVPRIEPTQEASFKEGKLTFRGTNFDFVTDLSWCRIKHKKDNKEHLYQVISRDSNKREVVLVEVTPLGNNGEYLEISTKDIQTAITETTEAVDNSSTESSIPEASNQEVDNESSIEGLTASEVTYYTKLLSEIFAKPETISKFRDRSSEDKQKVKNQYKDFFSKKFKEKGIKYDESEFEKLYKTFCG